MTSLNDVQFGRIEPSPEKMAQNNIYSFSALGIATVDRVEVDLPLPPGLVEKYNQGSYGKAQQNGCTGFSASWMSSINNFSVEGSVHFDGIWLYHTGQEDDGDPATTPARDNGGYVWAVMDVLRKKGHCKVVDGVTQPPQIANGIDSYYWCRSVDEIRTAFSLAANTSPPRCPVFGVNWYNKFMTPKIYNGEYWIGKQPAWGAIVGGHAICSRAISDNRGGLLWRNTWGAGYPEVWISYEAITRLLSEGGECAVAVDRVNIAPPPPAEKSYIDLTLLSPSGEIKMSGRLVEV